MNKPPIILHIALASPLRHSFDYLLPIEEDIQPLAILPPGIRIRVPFRRQQVIGILLGTSQHSTINPQRLRPALEIIDREAILPAPVINLCLKASHYYHYPIGEVILNTLPTSLRQGKLIKPLKLSSPLEQIPCPPAPSLSTDQQQAVATIIQNFAHFYPALLHGVTGSGKTEVYLHAIAHALSLGKQALVLVPEIGLTPQTVARFQQRFPIPIAILHSGIGDKARSQAWLMAKAGLASIVIGTRSAIFAPLPNLGIIIVDEEHDISYKQQDSFRYSARDLALLRGKLEAIPVILGSATPSLESFYHAKRGHYQLLSLPERAGNAIHPSFHIIDNRNQTLESGLSTHLFTVMQRHLQAGNQVLLFLNRRGYAPTLLCHHCGWVATCRRCDAHLTLHHSPMQLQCHHCGKICSVNSHCGDCQMGNLLTIGVGTQRLEQVLEKRFPDYAIVRIDRDTTRRKGKMQILLEDIHSQRSQILIGTQMLAKGHHFPKVTLVIILNIDDGLFSADFRAHERTAQLLVQVAGRAGRAEHPGEVWIPTHVPDNPLLNKLIKEGYQAYTQTALNERQVTELPPYTYLGLFRAEALKAELALNFLEQVKQLADSISGSKVHILGPIPAPMEKRAGRYRAQLLLQSSQRSALHHLLAPLVLQIEAAKWAKKVRWSLDIDPQEML